VPRLTNEQYLERHRALKRIWTEDQAAFGVLPYNQQMDIHQYFVPNIDLTDDELIRHRHGIQNRQPSRPQRASKACVKIELAVRKNSHRSVAAVPVPRGKRKITVTAIARPEPDLKRFAEALLELAKEQGKVDREDAS
jgi:hypothetical protein